ncbi:MAG: hypothetical protein KC454_07720 [Flavobacteriales bacterium]|nr:hypothetical protein [Flavobacteriales bacterium]
MGNLISTNQKIRYDAKALVTGFCYTPKPGTKIKANYRNHLTRDLLGNPPAQLGEIQFGIATYS